MWTTPRDLKRQLERFWERAELLREAVNSQSLFPLKLTIKGPGSADITDRFEVVRAWVSELVAGFPFRIEWQEVRHRVQGMQRLPVSAWIDSRDDAIRWIGKRRDWERFSAMLEVTRREHPALLPWFNKRPFQALGLAEEWPKLLSVVEWLKVHPRPGIYLRQVDIPGVHSKFLESHRPVLAELLDLSLPADCVDLTKTGMSRFSVRYGFLEKPVRIRFRILDSDIQVLQGISYPDITLDADSFSHLKLDVRRVFITENETNFLAFPHVPDSIIVFGSGYGWEALAKVHWLERCEVYYWGDIDTHGFAILDQLRKYFPHVTSLLMDRATLHACSKLWGVEDKPQRIDLHRLTREEHDLYNDLRDNRIRESLRLEQEHIGFDWVCTRLDSLH
ncbi:MAG TPA: DUF2220 family protein [Nitrosomonas europaea]|uniref:DUF3322 domain-containing protein n=1 Tax=Nitrosomonas europaea TaxID=915 RepID=UPI00249122A8|nr:Wadjet anti-phage system protein JetD domain-containing protein [Nitrosomonas europaea]HRN82046.1 DUF2220 family protein [Nitrosomonas europaea]HRO56075.1 DUF2220 family protein [Nitrosomonas europaea]HRQ08644.1 DUF2220 family protein [Nitrosomonas europaea]HUM73723.1 DUF2220 family protein [Nitrosomonas europaea]